MPGRLTGRALRGAVRSNAKPPARQPDLQAASDNSATDSATKNPTAAQTAAGRHSPRWCGGQRLKHKNMNFMLVEWEFPRADGPRLRANGNTNDMRARHAGSVPSFRAARSLLR